MSFTVVDKREIPFVQVDKYVLEDETLPGVAKLVYVLLCKFANYTTQECYPSHKTLAKLADVSKPTVIKALKTLENRKYIAIEHRTDGKQMFTNLYTILGVGKQVNGVGKQVNGVGKQVAQGSKPSLHEIELENENKLKENKESINIPPHEPAANKKAASDKIRYADFVTLTEAEHQKLVDKHGQAVTVQLIAKLNDYKGAHGKKYKSDYHAIHSWVLKAYLEEQERKPKEKGYQAKEIV